MLNSNPRSIVLAALLLVATHSSVEAQARFGIKGGVALANVYGDAVGNVELRNGITGGAFLEIPATPVLSAQFEALFTQKGAIENALIDLGGGVTLTEGTWAYDYIDIAALLKATFGDNVRISIYGGPVYSTLLSATAEGGGEEFDIKDLTKSSDIGGAGGVSLEFSRGFLVDVRYAFGTQAFDEPPLDLVYARQHNVIHAMVGLAIGR
ncbi:MAG: PorT family protein [Gemmatimonadetes bacterium]|nr:PorT family protein [Gemmatimonadota bacterium]NNM35450.1 PorT family protein [Gemmatimonadota bacterium]